jgi:tripartite ATP-independent transporter DctM subunit
MEMSAGLVALTLFGSFILLMLTGLPILFSMGAVAMIFVWLLLGFDGLYLVAGRVWYGVNSPIIVCLPMFIFMGLMLERSGVATNLYDMMQKWSGPLRGGMAAGTVVICMIMAAMTGLSAAATLTMGLTALPEMLKRNYNKTIALGCIGAGGALGILIPPSVTMVIYALVAQTSVGQLFMGGLFPGIILGSLFITYILIRSFAQPHVAPALPKEERATWREKWISLVHVLLPVFIIIMVLGSIFMGVATPTEAASVGALGTIISAAVNRKLNITSLKEACFGTARVAGMAMWMLVGALSIKSISNTVGAEAYIEDLFFRLPGGIWGVIIAMQLIWLVLGCLLDPIGILWITGPIFIPIVANAGMSTVWFGIVFVVNMEMAYLTPPFGFNLFYLKGVAPPEVTMGDIYRSIFPFLMCQLTCLVLVMVFPQLALWLPSQMIGR